MGMKEAVVSVLNNYANFSGRARRSEYWYFFLFNLLVGLVFGVLILIPREGSALYRIISGLSSLYSLAVFVPGLAVAWRRLHDIGRSGAYWFFNLIPLVGWIFVLVWLVREGDHGDNAYGSDPKQDYRYDYDYREY